MGRFNDDENKCQAAYLMGRARDLAAADRETCRRLLDEADEALRRAFAQHDKARHCLGALRTLLETEDDG